MKPVTFLKSLFLPTPKNKYKAYILKNFFLIPLTLILVGANLFYFVKIYQSLQVKGTENDLTTDQIIFLTNQKRQESDLPLLNQNTLLNQAALAKANHMIKTGVFEHYYEEEGQQIDPWQFVLDAGYDYYHAGENLAKNFSDSETLIQAWMDSPTHRDNLLNSSYQDIGVAVVEGPYLDKQNTTLVVQMFGTSTQSFLAANQNSPQPGTINFAPLVEHDKSFVQNAIISYPDLLFSATVLVTMIIGLTLVLDLTVKKPQETKQKISIDLWRH